VVDLLRIATYPEAQVGGFGLCALRNKIPTKDYLILVM
jgi:hypothetical protein